jgi:hypothetical protein
MNKSAVWVKSHLDIASKIRQDLPFLSTAAPVDHYMLKSLKNDGYLTIAGKTPGKDRHQVNVWQVTDKFKNLMRSYHV